MIVANRLPVDRVVAADGSVTWRRSPGGLVSALEPVMRGYDGAWIGWDGGTDTTDEPFVDDGMTLIPVPITAQEIEEFYEGFSNATLWPLYHDVVAKPEFHREWWDAYVDVNRGSPRRRPPSPPTARWCGCRTTSSSWCRRCCATCDPTSGSASSCTSRSRPWSCSRSCPGGASSSRGCWVPTSSGFQRPGGAQNFVRLVRQRVGHKTHRDLVYLPNGRTVQALAFPISIDSEGLETLARSDHVEARAKEIREQLGNPRKVLLGVDRLDYTKGIYSRLRAYGELIRDGHLSVEDAVFVQVATPSRERVEQYTKLRDDIDRLVGSLNGDLGRIGRPAISYLHSSYPKEEMAALFRAADICVVTPLRDGMNLVAKEYVACRYDDDGALVLSEFAGAADELRQAFMVNPYDINGMKSTILEAVNADPKDLSRRMKAMRKTVIEHDVNDWANAFLETLRQVKPQHHKTLRPAERS